ncbi:MAG: WGR domain-containing protein [Candidatus Obscuribacterales bacterium]|nr:WGR domain-containing protein [Candidatus Obscuribacterales bacterium]
MDLQGTFFSYRAGRVGSSNNPREKYSYYATEDRAAAECDKLIQEKLREGYEEVTVEKPPEPEEQEQFPSEIEMHFLDVRDGMRQIIKLNQVWLGDDYWREGLGTCDRTRSNIMYEDDERKEAPCNCDEAARLGKAINSIAIERIVVDGTRVYAEDPTAETADSDD